MERLVTTGEAAQLLGLSLQGVHYRIKSGQLKSLKQGGKTFVYVTEFFQQEAKTEPKMQSQASHFSEINDATQTVIQSKDEQISLLKQSIGFMKDQYKSEIRRLEKNQKRIIKVFNSEIKLLQSAFNEMRSVYKPQLEAQTQSAQKFIPINDFFVFLKQHNKTDKQIKIILLNAVQRKDPRFIYNKKTKKVLIRNADYSDLV